MWQQVYDPLHNSALSALLAVIPILFFLVGLTILKLKGLNAALLTLALALPVAYVGFEMPAAKVLATAMFGMLGGVWPIGAIVLMAVWFYKLVVASGKFEVIRGSIAVVSDDQRIQVILIAFCFGAFLEGAAGFGVPIAICAALLVELGFRPIKAAMLCLLANAAAGAYGAIGIPVLVGAQQGGVAVADLSLRMIAIVQLATLFIPTLLIFVLDGWRGVRETWPVLLLIGALFSGGQTATLLLLGPELTDIIAPLLSMAALAAFMQVWRPAHIYREADAPPVSDKRWSLHEVLFAWSPFYILTATILLWSLPAFKAVFQTGAPLGFTTFHLAIPFIHDQIREMPPVASMARALPAMWTVSAIAAPPTAILLAALLTIATSARLTLGDAAAQLKRAVAELWKPLAMISLVMAVAYVANYSGGSAAIGLALAQAGAVFPLIAPVIGWFGVFITGSVVNSNTLFAHLQAVTAVQIGTSPSLLVAANTSGGVMAKLISPQSVSIAAAAVRQVGHESTILRTTLGYSLALLGYVCVISFMLSLTLG